MNTDELLTVYEYARMRKREKDQPYRDQPIKADYIYKLIKKVNAGEKTWQDVGFEAITIAGRTFIKVLKPT